MNDLQIFNNVEFGEIRMVMIGGKPYAIGVDIARALEYAKPSQAVINHCKGILKLGIPSKGGTQETNVIPQGDIVRLVVRAAEQSKSEVIKAKAEKFESWIFDDVIPTILETGQYTAGQPSKKNPIYRSRMVKTAVKDLAGLVDVIADNFGVKRGMAMTAAMDMIGDSYGIDMTPLRLIVPAEEKPSYYTPTEIGKKLGNVSARQVNKMLEEFGLQKSENKKWMLTDKGKEFGEAVPFTRNGHSDYQIRWGESVLSILG